MAAATCIMRLLIIVVMTAAAGVDGKKGGGGRGGRGGGGGGGTKGRSGPPELHLEWFAPFMSGGGYSSEAIAFATALEPRIRRFQIAQHGEEADENFGLGIPAKTKALLDDLHQRKTDPDALVAVCHSEPGAWNVLEGAKYKQTNPCPPFEEPLYTIGRTMFETDRIPSEWVERCNKMDEIWVPTEFHRGTFAAAGVLPSKLFVIPEAVNTDFFDPAREKVKRVKDLSDVSWLPGRMLGGGSYAASKADQSDDDDDEKAEEERRKKKREREAKPEPFRFLSVFKWEDRKGWDVLLEAYVMEFTADDPVSLTLLTSKFHTDDDLVERVETFVTELAAKAREGVPSLPSISVVDRQVADVKMPSLYKSVDCLVLPSRGEGWGRPHVEAMAMEVPVIATNWSGPTAFLTDDNGYPLPIDGLVTVPSGPFAKFHKWAQPSVTELRRLMRHVVEHPEEAKAKGRRARQDMLERFTPDKLADIVVEHMWRIRNKLDAEGTL